MYIYIGKTYLYNICTLDIYNFYYIYFIYYTYICIIYMGH